MAKTLTPKVTRWTSKDTDRQYEFRPNVTSEKEHVTEIHTHGELLTRASDTVPWERVMFGELEDIIKEVETFAAVEGNKYKKEVL